MKVVFDVNNHTKHSQILKKKMGHGPYRANVIYGFREPDDEVYMNFDLLDAHAITLFSAEVVARAVPDVIFYGVVCRISYDGEITLSDKDRSKVDDFLALVSTFKEYEEPYFTTAIDGEFDYDNMTKYTPVDSSKVECKKAKVE
jgi:hypothetical protein